MNADVTASENTYQAIRSQGVPVQCAAWVRSEDDEDWRFIVGSPLVDTEGPKEFYRRVAAALERWTDGPTLPLDRIYARATSDRLVRALGRLEVSGQSTHVRNLAVEDAYVPEALIVYATRMAGSA